MHVDDFTASSNSKCSLNTNGCQINSFIQSSQIIRKQARHNFHCLSVYCNLSGRKFVQSFLQIINSFGKQSNFNFFLLSNIIIFDAYLEELAYTS